MKKIVFMKAFVLSCSILALFLMPNVANAQAFDNFFTPDFEDDWTRSVSISIASISNQGVGEPDAPLGSGLAILTLAGAGYAAFKRKRRNGAALMLMLVMMLGFTQCKKNLETINSVTSNKVHITLNVGDDKANVNPTGGVTYATVEYETGDKMYVGYNSKYVGYMTYTAGKGFSGDVMIEEQVGDQPLHFYYLGGKGYDQTIAGNTISVDISDQGVVDYSETVHRFPIISYSPSTENYPTGDGKYTARLRNKCAMVKFNVEKPEGYDKAGTCIAGLNNLVTVDFTRPKDEGNGFTYSQINDGTITIDSKVGTVWAILLPQEDITAGGDMTVFSGCHKGARPAIGTIAENEYKSEGVDLVVKTEFVPGGALNGLFKVGDDKYVRFAKANLKATTTDGWNTWTWGFKDTQYEYETKGEVGTNYSNKSEVSLFGWATSGYNLRGAEDSKYFYKPNMTGIGNTSSYAPVVNVKTDITGAYAKGDWGYNRITNNGYKQWRVLTKDEWDYLIANHKMGWTKIPASNNNNRGFGIMILPYGNNGDIKSSYSLSEWEALEAQGAVFFPVCGYRVKSGDNQGKISYVDTFGYLWTSTCYENNGKDYCVQIKWAATSLAVTTQSGCYGHSVRLVCE